MIVTASFFSAYQFWKAFALIVVELVRVGLGGLLLEDLEEVQRRRSGCRRSSLTAADRRREDRRRQAVVELALGDPADVAALAGLRARRSSPGRACAKSAAAGASFLSFVISSLSGGRYMTWTTCQPKELLNGGRISPGLRPSA